MKVLSWNIRQGGGRRLEAIVAAIKYHAPDVVVINEFRARSGPPLVGALNQIGLRWAIHNEPAGLGYGILVAARVPLRRLADTRPTNIVPRSLLEVALPDSSTIGALYGPMLTPEHGAFWDATVDHATQQLDRPYLLIGDFNTGEAGVDCHKPRFAGSSQFVRLQQLGFRDLWRQHNPGTTEHTWFSFGRGGTRLNGFRIDHALATPPLAGRAIRCRYSHDERERKISDHSVLLVEFSSQAA